MGLESNLFLACGVLTLSVFLFGYWVFRAWKAFSQKFTRLDRKLNDVAIYLSHVNEDRAHLEKMANNKVDENWAEKNLSVAFADFKRAKSESRGRARISITAK
ncbi:hypothetical protein HY989_06065 [Candidatus Micrarchaeota archaeon]|nr:hypothetical protein [Candidatus Micrarchaeota archaeon]